MAKLAISKKMEVTSISTKKPVKKRFLKQVKYKFCDITKLNNLRKIITNRFDYIVNFGGYVDHTDKKKTFKSHYFGCVYLTKTVFKFKPSSFVQIGSGGEYGKLRSPHKENYVCKATSNYSKAKLLSTKFLMNLYKEKKFPSTVIRLYQAYGSKQDLNRFLPVVITNCLKNKKFSTSNGSQYRDFIHVNDLVNAIYKILIIKKTNGQIINIGSGKPIKIKNIILKIIGLCKGGRPQFGQIKLRKEENLKTYPNINKAKKLLKWKPKISFNKGIAMTINSYEKNR